MEMLKGKDSSFTVVMAKISSPEIVSVISTSLTEERSRQVLLFGSALHKKTKRKPRKKKRRRTNEDRGASLSEGVDVEGDTRNVLRSANDAVESDIRERNRSGVAFNDLHVLELVKVDVFELDLDGNRRILFDHRENRNTGHGVFPVPEFCRRSFSVDREVFRFRRVITVELVEFALFQMQSKVVGSSTVLCGDLEDTFLDAFLQAIKLELCKSRVECPHVDAHTIRCAVDAGISVWKKKAEKKKKKTIRTHRKKKKEREDEKKGKEEGWEKEKENRLL
jgi:hypothetical protein